MTGEIAHRKSPPLSFTSCLTPREPRWIWLSLLFLAGGPLNPFAWYLATGLDKSGDFHGWVIPAAATIGTAFAVGFLHLRKRSFRAILFLSAKSAGVGWMFAVICYVMLMLAEQLETSPDPIASALTIPLLMIPALLVSFPIALGFALIPALVWGAAARLVAFRISPQPAEIAAP